MANDRLKRRLLRELVQENVDLIEGVAPWQPRPSRGGGGARLAARVLALTLLPLGLLGSGRLISTLAPAPAARQAETLAGAAVPAPGGAMEQPPGGAAAKGPAGEAPGRPAGKSPGVAATPASFPPPAPIDPAVFPLAVRKVALDPGHGGDSLGTHSHRGLVEKELTLDISRRLERLLAERRFEVVLTREEDRSVSLDDRARIANKAGADIFVSIHLNWIENRQARGVETYYLGPTDDPFLSRLAAAENRDSGYSLADLRGLLDRIYADVRQDNSRRLAESVQGSLFRSLGKVNPSLADRGVKAAPFIVLLSTEMPAILAEVSCLSNEEEARLLTKPLYRQYIAEALADGIGAYADAVARSGGKGT